LLEEDKIKEIEKTYLIWKLLNNGKAKIMKKEKNSAKKKKKKKKYNFIKNHVCVDRRR
jgi:hypothetical protein